LDSTKSPKSQFGVYAQFYNYLDFTWSPSKVLRANEEFISNFNNYLESTWSPPKVPTANEELTPNKKKMLIPGFEPGPPGNYKK
jgi:hypothetical protein